MDDGAARVQDRRVRKQEQPAHRRADAVLAHGSGELGHRAFLDHRVRVEEEQDVSARMLGPEVAAARVAEVSPRAQHLHIRELELFVAVVDDDDFELCSSSLERVDAAEQRRPGLVRHDHDGDEHDGRA